MSSFKKTMKDLFGDKLVNRVDLFEILFNHINKIHYNEIGKMQVQINDLEGELFHEKNKYNRMSEEKEKLKAALVRVEKNYDLPMINKQVRDALGIK